MGFDLYGVNPIAPKNNKLEIKALEEQIKKLQDDTELDTADKEERKWALEEKIESLNPGIYFRNNVWWWRPLWNYVCEACDDILTEKDMTKGSYNDGHKISKAKALKIANRLQEQLDNGDVEAWDSKYQLMLQKLPDEDCGVCDGTGYRLKPPKAGAGSIPCNGCNETGKRKHFAQSYPFNVKNVEEFAIFAKHSGGFSVF